MKFWCFVVLLTASSLLTGCGSGQPDVDPSVSDPETLYQLCCAKCHARAGDPGGPKLGGSRGPDLTYVGSNEGMNVEYLTAYIREPESVRPDARLMPAFRDTLTEQQIRILAEWLMTKTKGQPPPPTNETP